MPKISVIVPVYNTEQYLHRCIDSILAQTFPDFELLLIDDGSKDNSGRICDEYAAKDSRIRVFHKENGGVSSARNLGLDTAQGEWIAFVDSDDWLKDRYLDAFISKCVNNTQIIIQSIEIVGKHSKEVSIPFLPSIDFLDTIAFMSRYGCLGHTPTKLFKKSIIDDINLRFNLNYTFCEDEHFVLMYLSRISHIVVVKEKNYFYDMPTYSEKYNNVDKFEVTCALYRTAKELFAEKWNPLYERYLREATQSLFDAFATKDKQRTNKLRAYKELFGHNIIREYNLSFVTRILVMLPTFIASPMLDLKTSARYGRYNYNKLQ